MIHHYSDQGSQYTSRDFAKRCRRPRDVMYMAALSASRHNPRMKEMYDRLRARGKHHKVAVVAVMRKLVALVNTLLRKRRMWSAEIAAAGCAAPPPGARPVQRTRQDGFVRLGDVLGRTMGRA